MQWLHLPIKDYHTPDISFERSWETHGAKIRDLLRNGSDIVLHHEWMDVRRVIHMNMKTHPKEGARSSLGHSIGHLEGDILIIV